MSRRKNKKRQKYTWFIYRGICVEVNGPYTWKGTRWKVCIHTPDVERYGRNTSGVRRFIDKFLSTWQEPEWPCTDAIEGES